MTTARKPANKKGDEDDNKKPAPTSKAADSHKHPSPRKAPPVRNTAMNKSDDADDDRKPPAIASTRIFADGISSGRNAPAVSSAVDRFQPPVVSFGSSPSLLSFNPMGMGMQQSIMKDGLAAFGIKPAAGGRSTFIDKNSRLKCCLISGAEKSAIVFRVEPNDPTLKGGSWAEKCFFDAVRQNQRWITSINIDGNVLAWFHQNVAQKNPKGYSIRLFVIYTDKQLPPHDNIINLGRYICQQLNSAPGNTTTTVLQQENFFWLPDGAVWSDIIGCDAALLQLVKDKGHPCPGYYDTHRAVIHGYFHAQTFSVELARSLHAPVDQVHPSLRAAFLRKKPADADDVDPADMHNNDDVDPADGVDPGDVHEHDV